MMRLLFTQGFEKVAGDKKESKTRPVGGTIAGAIAGAAAGRGLHRVNNQLVRDLVAGKKDKKLRTTARAILKNNKKYRIPLMAAGGLFGSSVGHSLGSYLDKKRGAK